MIGLKETFTTPLYPIFLPSLVEKTFGEGGWLESSLGLEHRPQQKQMAFAAAQAFVTDKPLLFEAGTGVGKSLAYLIPAIIHATETKRQCLVSTHTISLQEQIAQKDLPICHTLFEAIPSLTKYRSFKTALLVGRANYLCPTRLLQAIKTKAELFQSAEQEELERLKEWIQLTSTGLLQELNPPPLHEVWDWVNADAGACNRRNCSPESCFFQKARARLRHAQIIILNHSLLFSLINAGASPRANTPGVLFANDFTIIDEAHTVTDVATEHFGQHISSYGMDRFLKRLYHPHRQKGILIRHGRRDDCAAVERAIYEAKVFFAGIRQNQLCKQEVVRLYREGWCAPSLNPFLHELSERVALAADKLEDGPERENLLDLRRRLKNYNHAINDCINLASRDHVYWVESSGHQRQIVILRTAPIDVAPVLHERLFERKTAVILTSATLSEGPTMDRLATEVGAPGALAKKVSSPFHYEKYLRIFIATDAPTPNSINARLNLDYLADMIRFCTLRIRGGSLVLFTNYADMRQVATQLEDSFRKAGHPFFIQRRDGPRNELTRRFAAAGNGVLFGTDSFWTGVDIPGPALSQVIITRLPFENPTHPIAEAKSDWIKTRGGNPFADLTLPKAVLKLRQGIGRLIRNKSDCGTVTLMDSRLLTREYGQRFLAVLPNPQFERLNRLNRTSVFKPLEAD